MCSQGDWGEEVGASALAANHTASGRQVTFVLPPVCGLRFHKGTVAGMTRLKLKQVVTYDISTVSGGSKELNKQ